MNYYIPYTDTVYTDDTYYIDSLAEKAFNKYLNTIRQIGYIDSNDVNVLIIYPFLVEYYNSIEDIDDETKKDIVNMIDCIKNNSCLFN